MAKAPMLIDSWLCPACKTWITMPFQRRRAAQLAHLKACSLETYKQVQASTAELIGEPTTTPTPAKTISVVDRANARIRIDLLKHELASATGVRKAQLTAQLRAAERRIGEQ